MCDATCATCDTAANATKCLSCPNGNTISPAGPCPGTTPVCHADCGPGASGPGITLGCKDTAATDCYTCSATKPYHDALDGGVLTSGCVDGEGKWQSVNSNHIFCWLCMLQIQKNTNNFILH